MRHIFLDGTYIDTLDTRECVICGTTSTSLWRHDLTGNYLCHDCQRNDSPIRSLQRTSRHLVRHISILDLWFSNDFIYRKMKIMHDNRQLIIHILFLLLNQQPKFYHL